jgi:hypothetical protein
LEKAEREHAKKAAHLQAEAQLTMPNCRETDQRKGRGVEKRSRAVGIRRKQDSRGQAPVEAAKPDGSQSRAV